MLFSNANLVYSALVLGSLTHSIFKSRPDKPKEFLPLVTRICLFIAFVFSAFAIATGSVIFSLQLVSTFTVSWLSGFLVTLTVSRLFFHPLASVPGPFLAKISKFWILSVTATGRRHLKLQELHKKYGDVVRIGPNEISVLDVAAIKVVYGNNGFIKGPQHDAGREIQGEQNMTNLRNHEEHSKRRKVWDRAFTPSALQGYEPFIVARLQQFVSYLSARTNQELELGLELGCFTWTVMSDFGLGGELDFMKEGGGVDKSIIGYLKENRRIGAVGGAIPELQPILRRLPTKGATHAIAYHNLCTSSVTRRSKAGSLHQRKDVLYYLMGEDGSSDQKPPLARVFRDSTLLVSAGADSTSNVLCLAFYHLLKNKNAYKKLEKYIDDAFRTNGWTELENVPLEEYTKIPYLSACLNEVLRLAPAIASGSQRYSGDNSAAFGDFVIPKRTTVRIPSFALHRDPRYFGPDPEEFRPERWIESETKLPGEVLVQEAFVPFSTGPYGCVAKKLATTELSATLVWLIRNFNFNLSENFDQELWDAEELDWTDLLHGPLKVTLTKKKIQD